MLFMLTGIMFIFLMNKDFKFCSILIFKIVKLDRYNLD